MESFKFFLKENRGACRSNNWVFAIEQGIFSKELISDEPLMIACLEEIAFRQGYINVTQLEGLAAPLAKSVYGQYLYRLLEEQHLPAERAKKQV